MQTAVTRILCDACLDLPVAIASPAAHPTLKATGPYQNIASGDSEAPFQCSECGTIWLHRKNKWGTCEGFRLNP